jgi:hypothetical protein
MEKESLSSGFCRSAFRLTMHFGASPLLLIKSKDKDISPQSQSRGLGQGSC